MQGRECHWDCKSFGDGRDRRSHERLVDRCVGSVHRYRRKRFCAVYIKISRLRKKPRYFSVVHVLFKYCAGIRLDLVLILDRNGAERDLVAPHAVIKLDPCFEP